MGRRAAEKLQDESAEDQEDWDKVVPEGVEAVVPYRGYTDETGVEGGSDVVGPRVELGDQRWQQLRSRRLHLAGEVGNVGDHDLDGTDAQLGGAPAGIAHDLGAFVPTGRSGRPRSRPPGTSAPGSGVSGG